MASPREHNAMKGEQNRGEVEAKQSTQRESALRWVGKMRLERQNCQNSNWALFSPPEMTIHKKRH